jgi:hypothetical protein
MAAPAMNGEVIQIVRGRAGDEEYAAAVTALMAVLGRGWSPAAAAPPKAQARAGWDRHPGATYLCPRSWQCSKPS